MQKSNRPVCHSDEGGNSAYSITVVCPHDIAEIRTLTAVCGCETTVLVCTDCGKQLSTPKTDCA